MNIFRIEAPHFVAGGTLSADFNVTFFSLCKVTMCAPIIHYMRTWNLTQIKLYCEQKGWDLSYWKAK